MNAERGQFVTSKAYKESVAQSPNSMTKYEEKSKDWRVVVENAVAARVGLMASFPPLIRTNQSNLPSTALDCRLIVVGVASIPSSGHSAL